MQIEASSRPSPKEIVREWGRLGCIGFGGPPAHIALLRQLCVQRHGWLREDEFEHAIAACNLLPGPASTQLAIFCAWRVAGPLGAVAGGLAFIIPGLVLILALAAVCLAASAPEWVRGASAGAGAAVAAVAVRSGVGLVPASWRRSPARVRWLLYALAGGASAATIGPWLVVVLLCAGALELACSSYGDRTSGSLSASSLDIHAWLLASAAGAATGGLLALSWVAFKVGALSYGGGFVIVPLMQAETVNHYHWMSSGQFLDAVALGQLTPGPVVQTVAVVGYAAAGLGGALLAAVIAFAPSFSFILLGAERFGRLRANLRAQAFLAGAGPAAIGAIIGSALPLAGALTEAWQFAVLLAAAIALLLLGRSIVATLLAAAAVGLLAAVGGAPIPR